jgi:hypothetical protein
MKSHRLKNPAIIIGIGILILVSAIAIYQFTKPITISFEVIEPGYSLIAPRRLPRQEPEPPLIIIASPEDMQLPSNLAWPEPLAMQLKGIDFKQSVVILARRGRQGDSGTIQKVERQQDTVVIRSNDLVIGPGNYVSDGWTQPYEAIAMHKEASWNKTIHFVLQRETQGMAGEIHHFVP